MPATYGLCLSLKTSSDPRRRTYQGHKTALESARNEAVRALLRNPLPLQATAARTADNEAARKAAEAVAAVACSKRQAETEAAAQKALAAAHAEAARKAAEAAAAERSKRQAEADAAAQKAAASKAAASAEAVRMAAEAVAAAERNKRQAEVEATAQKAAAEKAVAQAVAARHAAEARAAALERERAAEAEAAARASSSVPAELASWLAALELSEHGARLVKDYKLRFVQDCRVLDREDLLSSGLLKVEAERFLKAATKLGGDTKRLSGVTAAPSEGLPTPSGPRATVRALVIGINAYAPVRRDDRGIITPGSGLGALDNAVADAKAVHEALSRLPGAASTLLLDCTKSTMEQVLKDFRDSAGLCKERGMKVVATKDGTSRPRTLGVVYFAGHGMQLNKSNYMVPADWVVPNANEDPRIMEGDAADGCVSLESVEKLLSQTTMTAGSILLDCCRNTPDFVALAPSKSRGADGTSRSLPLGLADVSLRLRDLMVTFATAPGTCALDCSSRMPSHSPFTAALLKALAVPGLTLLRLNPLLTQEVEADTGGVQRPYVGGSYGLEAADVVLL